MTTRSVLIYVDDKTRAFREFFRVLRPGGRASVSEPINNYFPDTPDEFWGFDSRPVRDLVQKVYKYEGWIESEYANDPMMNFNTKELLRHRRRPGSTRSTFSCSSTPNQDRGSSMGTPAEHLPEPQRPHGGRGDPSCALLGGEGAVRAACPAARRRRPRDDAISGCHLMAVKPA